MKEISFEIEKLVPELNGFIAYLQCVRKMYTVKNGFKTYWYMPENLPASYLAGSSSGSCRRIFRQLPEICIFLALFTTCIGDFYGKYCCRSFFRHVPEIRRFPALAGVFPAQYTAGRFSGTCRTFFRHVPEVHFIFPTVLVMPEDKMSLRQLPEGKIHLR